MSGWDIFMVAAVCASGALLFLRIAAGEIEARGQHLDKLESSMRKAWQRHKDEQAGEEEPIVLTPLGKTETGQ